MRLIMGRAKAPVFPVPVGALPTRSEPLSKTLWLRIGLGKVFCVLIHPEMQAAVGINRRSKNFRLNQLRTFKSLEDQKSG